MLGANDIGTLAVVIGHITTVSTGYDAVTIAPEPAEHWRHHSRHR
jgi:hypothetical protein